MFSRCSVCEGEGFWAERAEGQGPQVRAGPVYPVSPRPRARAGLGEVGRDPTAAQRLIVKAARSQARCEKALPKHVTLDR